MHHVLYEWSELVEIDQQLTKLEKGIELIKEINSILYKNERRSLISSVAFYCAILRTLP